MAPDVIVVGAGVIGVACAEALARAGLRVLVLDAGNAGAGCTAAGGGVLSLQTKRPGIHLQLARRSLALLHAAPQRLDAGFGLRWCGSLVLAGDEAGQRHLEARSKELAAGGVETRWLDGAEARTEDPELAPDIVGASSCAADGQLEPRRLHEALLRSAVRHGVTLRQNFRVLQLEVAAGRVRAVRGEGERVSTGNVVVAAGWESGRLLAPIDPAWRECILPRRGVLLRSAPVRAVARHVLLEAGYYSAKVAAQEHGRAFSLQQTEEGELWLGGNRSAASAPAEVSAAERAEILARAGLFVPALRQVDFRAATVGIRPASIDGLPYIGPTAVEGLWVAAGHEGDGVTLALVTAELISDALFERPLSPEAAGVSPLRCEE